MDIATVKQMLGWGFPGHLGIEYLEATPDRVRAEMKARPELCTVPDVVQGGALMSFADTLGAAATFLNLPPGTGTTTLESKTNFIRPAPLGSTIVGECLPIHRGKSTMVWQTRITSEDGALIAVVTQTQMVLQTVGR